MRGDRVGGEVGFIAVTKSCDDELGLRTEMQLWGFNYRLK